MFTKRYVPVLIIFLAFLLMACGLSGLLGGNTIVGRWELLWNDEGTAGNIYEIYADGTGAGYVFNSAFQFDYPVNIGTFTYTYDAGAGLLHMTPTDVPEDAPEEAKRTRTFEVTFVSDDELMLKASELPKGWTYLRAPLPEMPIRARGALGGLLLLDGHSLVSTERLKGDWQTQFPGYSEIHSTAYEDAMVDDPEQWAAIIQVEGEAEPRLYILVEGKSYWWGVIELEKQE